MNKYRIFTQQDIQTLEQIKAQLKEFSQRHVQDTWLDSLVTTVIIPLDKVLGYVSRNQCDS